MGYKRKTLQTVFIDPDVILKTVANLEKKETEPKQRDLYDSIRQMIKLQLEQQLEQQDQETKETIIEGLESLLEVL